MFIIGVDNDLNKDLLTYVSIHIVKKVTLLLTHHYKELGFSSTSDDDKLILSW